MTPDIYKGLTKSKNASGLVATSSFSSARWRDPLSLLIAIYRKARVLDLL
jgi:hypothetical protein